MADDIAQIGFGVDTRDLDKADKKLDDVERSTKRLGESGSRNMRQAGSSFESFSRRATGALSSVNQRMTRFMARAAKLGAAVGAAGLAGALFKSIQAFSEFERQMVEVGKTTDLQGAQLDRLGERIQMIARTVPISTSRLQGLAVAAGQLGVTGVENVAAFTETLGKLETATDLAGEEGARSLARLLNITGRSQSEISNLGSAITALGNNFATTEQEITRTTTFLASATTSYGVTAEQVLGLSAALRDLGQRAETSGSAVGAALQAINTSIAEGGSELRTLTQLLGQSQQQIREAFGENSTAVLLDFAEALDQLPAAEQTRVLDEFGLAGRETVRVLNALISNTDRVRRAVSMSNTEWEKNEALNIEAARAAESFSAQMRFLGNALNEAAVDIGRELAPVVLDLTEKFRDFIQESSDSGQLERFFENVADAAQALLDKVEAIARAMAAIGGASMGGRAGAAIGSLGGPVGTAAGGAAGAVVGGISGFFTPEIASGGVNAVAGRRRVFQTQEDRLREAGLNPEAIERLRGGGTIEPGMSVPGIGGNDGGNGDASDDSPTGGGSGGGEISRAEKMRREEMLRITEKLNEEERERDEAIQNVTRSLETEAERVNRVARENEKIIRLIEDEDDRRELLSRNEKQRQEELARIREANASEYEKILDNAAENVQEAFGDTFTDIFRNGVDSFGDLFDRVKDIAARAAGEIAAIFAQRAFGNALLSISGGNAQGGGGLFGDLARSIGGGESLFGGVTGGEGSTVTNQVARGVAKAFGFDVGKGAAGLSTQIGAKLGFRGDIIANSPALASASESALAGEQIGGRFSGTLSDALGSAGTIVGGALTGYSIGSLFGDIQGENQTGSKIGGAVGGGLGAAAGTIGGAVGSVVPVIGTALGSFAGAFTGGSTQALIEGDTSSTNLLRVLDPITGMSKMFGEDTHEGWMDLFDGKDSVTSLSKIFGPVFGTSLSEALGLIDTERPRLGLRTVAEDMSGFKGRSFVSPFGRVGISNQTSETAGTGLSDDELTPIAELVQQTDEQIAEFLTDQQIEAVRSALQDEQEFGRKAISDERNIGNIFARRFVSIFEALEMEIPKELQKLRDHDSRKSVEKTIGAFLTELVVNRVEQITEEINQITENLQEPVSEMLQFRQAFGRADESIEQQLFRMTGTSESPLSPTERLSNARSQFEGLLSEAQGGDIDALQQVSGSAQNFLDIARTNFASSPEFFQRFDFVQDSLSGLQGVISEQQGRIDSTLSDLNINIDRQTQMTVGRLDTLIETTREQSDRLEELGDKLERLEAA